MSYWEYHLSSDLPENKHYSIWKSVLKIQTFDYDPLAIEDNVRTLFFVDFINKTW